MKNPRLGIVIGLIVAVVGLTVWIVGSASADESSEVAQTAAKAADAIPGGEWGSARGVASTLKQLDAQEDIAAATEDSIMADMMGTLGLIALVVGVFVAGLSAVQMVRSGTDASAAD